MSKRADVVIVGAGHNGLVAALMLARAGLRVRVLEEQSVIGGACRTEYPFTRTPQLPTSTGAYLLGLMPPELLEILEVDIPVLPRDPHYFLPTTDNRYLLFGSDEAALEEQFTSFFSRQDWRAHVAMSAEIAAMRDDIAPTWLAEPLSIEDTAMRYVRPQLRDVFIDLCRQPIRDYLARFDFKSDLVKAMYAVTDGFSGLYGSWDTPGTGMNFLIHNMCRLPDTRGTFAVVQGGMGTVTSRLAAAAQRHGAVIETGVAVESLAMRGDSVEGVVLRDGREVRADVVVFNADPFRMQEMIGADQLPEAYNRRIAGYARPGSTFKVNLALSGLPRFTCLPEDRGQYGPTIHLLPPEEGVIASLTDGFDRVQNGELIEFPTIEWYIHSTVDPGLTDAAGHLSSALFVQWVPYELAASDWETEAEPYARKLLAIADRFAPGTSDLVADMFVLHPRKIEDYFGIRHGHIHHVDNSFGFADRLPYATPIAGVYSCSAGTHPAGSVIGCAGHNAAQRVLGDLGKKGSE